MTILRYNVYLFVTIPYEERIKYEQLTRTAILTKVSHTFDFFKKYTDKNTRRKETNSKISTGRAVQNYKHY